MMTTTDPVASVVCNSCGRWQVELRSDVLEQLWIELGDHTSVSARVLELIGAASAEHYLSCDGPAPERAEAVNHLHPTGAHSDAHVDQALTRQQAQIDAPREWKDGAR